MTLPEQLQNSSILRGVPLSCIVFYDPHERRKRGLDKAAMEICFAVVDNAVSTESVRDLVYSVTITSVHMCFRFYARICAGGY